MNGAVPELVTVPSVTTAVVRGRVAPDELRNFFDTSFSTLSATLGSSGHLITGTRLWSVPRHL